MDVEDANSMTVMGSVGEVLSAAINWVFVVFLAGINLLRSLITIIPIILLFLFFGAIGVLIAYTHADIQEGVEKWRREYAVPTWQNSIRPIVDLFRIFINAIQCTFYGISWWTYGLVNDHLIPALFAADVRPLAETGFQFFTALLEDLVIDYFISFKFFSEPMDFTRIFAAWADFWTEYQAIVCYFCNSLCTLWSVQPVINPIPFATTFAVAGFNIASKVVSKIVNLLAKLITAGEADPPIEDAFQLELPINVWDIPILGWPINFFALLGSDSIKDTQTLNALGSAFNAVFALLRVFSRMISQAILQQPVDRPDFNETVTFLCSFTTAFVRSCENAFQRMIDAYIPINFQFENFLCIIDAVICWALYSVDVILIILINIDRIVTYKGGGDGNTFYPDVVKPRVALVINLLGEPDKTDCDDRSCCTVNLPLQPEFADINCYWMDPTDDRSLMWDPVLDVPRFRISECLCIFIERILCDQGNTGTCLQDGFIDDNFSFCCLTDAILELVADLLAGLFELTLNFHSTDAIFRFIDRNKFLFFLKVNIVQIIDCIFSVFSLIPTVGPCLRIIFVRVFAVLLCLVEIIIRYIIALFTLPYFIVFGESSFVLDPARGAQAEWEAIIRGVTDSDDETSLVNCLSFILNYGIPIPPIPCMECEPSGFITPSPDVAIELGPPGSFENIMQLIKDDPSFAFYGQFTGLARLTPIRRYKNETAVPWVIRDMIAQNAPYAASLIQANMASVDHKADATLKRIRNRSPPRFTPMRVNDEGEWIRVVSESAHSTGLNHTVDKSVQSGLAPTKPPLVGCSPTPPCFDLACYFRARLQWLGFLFEAFGRIWTAFIQAGTTNFEYFTDGGLEADLTLGIRLFVQRYVCMCDLLNLIIPVVGRWGGRPDFCCAIIRTADLAACILQTTINAIKSLALGRENDFEYFKNGDFEKDLDVNFDITIEIVVCLCNLIRAIFPFIEANGFDVCCFPEVIVTTAVEILRLFLFTILNLALLAVPKGKAYFQLDNPATDDIDELPFVVRVDAVINSFFGVDIPSLNEASEEYAEETNDAFNIPDEYEPVCGQPQGGLGFCVANLLDTLIPARPRPLEPVANDNCPFINLSCFTSELFNFMAGIMRFNIRLLTTLWQPWEEQADGRKQPIVFFRFLICDENAPPGHPEYSASCGKLDPVLDAATSLLGICPCEIIQFIDYFIALIPIFSGWDCFCGNGIPTRPPEGVFAFPDPAIDIGIIPRLGFILRALLEVVLQTLLRRIPNPAFWANRDLIMTTAGEQPADSLVELFFMPITDAICDFFVALSCIPANLIFWVDCDYSLERLFASVIAWAMEVVIRALEFLEAIATFFASFGPDDVPDTDENGDPIEDPAVTSGGDGNPTNTIDTQTLTAAILNIVLLPLDLLIADSTVDLPQSRSLVPLADCPEGRPVDGILMAFFRYLGCILGPLGQIFSPIIFLLSFVWQLLGAVIYFVTSLILFIFTLIFSVFGDCSCYQCDDDNSNDWIDDPTNLSPPQPAKSGDCAGVCEHTSQRGALCYTPCYRNILNGEFDNDDFDYTDGPGPGSPTNNLFTCRRDTGQDTDEEDVSNCRGYGFDPLPLCSAASLISQFFGVIKAFFGIFTGDIQVPEPFPTARDLRMEMQRPKWERYAGEKTQRQVFSEKVQAWKQSRDYMRPEELHRRFSIEIPDDLNRTHAASMDDGEPVTVPEIVFDAMYGIDMRDCIHNITHCICDHFHLAPEDLDCRHADLTTVTTDQVTMAMSHMIHNTMREGTTEMALCESVICDCEGELWLDLPYERRVEYVDCLERRAKGERMHELMPTFPMDFYYRVDGPSILAHTALGAIQSSLHGSARKEAHRAKEVEKSRANERIRIQTHKNYFQWRLEQRGYPKGYTSMALPYMRRLDRLERDWRSGRLSNIFSKARRNIALGDWYFDNHAEAIRQLGHSSLHLTKTIMKAPVKRFVLESYDAVKMVGRVVTRFNGLQGSVADWASERTMEIAKERMNSPQRKRAQQKIDQLWVGIENSPLYQWYYGPKTSKSTEPSGLTPFVNHVKRVVAHHRQNVDRVQWSFFNLDRKIYALKDHLVARWSFDKDTPNKRANRDMLRILTESVAAKLWPESYPDHEERFLFNSDCLVADGVLQTSQKVFGYCINEFKANYENRTARHTRSEDDDLWRDDGYHTRANMYYPEVPEHERDLHPLKRTWRRPKVDMEAIKAKRDAKRTRFVDLKLSHHRQWRRLIMNHPQGIFGVAHHTSRQSGLDSGPTAWQGRFSLITWLICLFEDFTSTTFSMEVADFIVDVREWLLEDNLDPTMGDVGAAYWARFLYTCDWPNSVNCSMGVGLSKAIYDVSFWFLIVFVLLSIIFPATLLPIIAFGLLAFYIIVVFVYAFRWSPRCLILTPTFLFGLLGGIDEDTQVPGAGAIAGFSRGVPTGLSVPFFAAASFPVFPMCLPDELFGLIDSWFALCGDFLEGTRWDFLLPDYMINGPRCPAMGEQIDVQSCADLGMGDGLTNALYLTYWLFPTICDWVMRLGQSCYADYFPGSIVYLSAVLESFKDIPQTQMDRLTWCFWATLPSLGLVIALLLIIFTLVAIALTIVAATIRLLYAAFIVLPIACCGGCRIRRSTYALEKEEDDDEDEEDDYEQEIAARYHRYGNEGIGSSISGFLNRHIFRLEAPKRKKD